MHRKNVKNIAAALLTAAVMVMPCYAQDGPGARTLEENMSGQLDEQYAVKGNYAISRETGDIFFSEDSQTFFVNGVASDGCMYDETGKQVNTLSYIRDKYLPQYETESVAGPGNLITFESRDDMENFLCWFQLEKMDHQGDLWRFAPKTYDGKQMFEMDKSELTSRLWQPDEAYNNFVDGIVAKLTPGSTTDAASTYAMNLVAQTMDYDKSYLNATMNQAIQDGKGVCYHYTKLLKDVLTCFGIESEVVYGNMTNGQDGEMHVWLKIWDKENSKWIYRDPTRASMCMDSGMFAVDIYEIYAEYYRQEGVV